MPSAKTFDLQKPPIIGPTAGATAIGNTINREIFGLSSGENVRNNIAIPTGVKAPTSTLNNTKIFNEVISFAIPHNADAVVKRKEQLEISFSYRIDLLANQKSEGRQLS